MIDKNWLLNPTAIHAAKDCIHIIQTELDIRLKLSHPQFLEMIQQYIELTESENLQNAYLPLAELAGIHRHKARILDNSHKKVVDMPSSHKPVTPRNENPPTDETVSYHGKLYQRYQDGLEFKGLYRGQPRYA